MQTKRAPRKVPLIYPDNDHHQRVFGEGSEKDMLEIGLLPNEERYSIYATIAKQFS